MPLHLTGGLHTRTHSGLADVGVAQVLERLAARTQGHAMRRDTFGLVMRELLPVDAGPTQRAAAQACVDKLFDLYKDASGAVRLSDIAPGLTVLCGGSRERKVDLCFYLYVGWRM